MDQFENSGDSLIAPAKDAFDIVPSDSTPLPVATKAIYVGTGGHLVLRTVDGKTDIRLANISNGAILPIRVLAVRQTGTTATDIVGLI
ncbi:spike base protein, RCAP_Rcc01079 family [Erythrobacter colymbi]|uniref:spike base protein, RCAP_Rcc01079 family n=1 Tax=Erythrobacter colymbi TaxID=1161202 RepID=UPI000A3BB6BF|nr:hypothetical protein [Erythrobacter colymbi]